MTVGPTSDAARAKRAAARAERLQTSTVDETLVDIARGADPVSGGESSKAPSSHDDSVDGGATRGGGGSKWESRGRRKRDLSATSMYKCQNLPDVLPESCKETSKFCDNENALWEKLGLTNIPGLAETSRKKGGERFALSQSIMQAMTKIKTLSIQAGLPQQPGVPAGGAVVTHVLVPGQEVRVFRNPADRAESFMTFDAAGAASMREQYPTWVEDGPATNAIHTGDADPARANANRESNDEGAACAARADGVIPTNLNGFGLGGAAIVAAWEESFEVKVGEKDVRCAPLRVWTRAERDNAWGSVPPAVRKNLSNKFSEWLGAYWALTHLQDALQFGVTSASRVKDLAKAGRALHKKQADNDLTFEIVAAFATARAIERAERERANEGASAPAQTHAV